MTGSVARSLCDSWASCSDSHEHLIDMYTYWVSLLHWMQQLCCSIRRRRDTDNSQHCNVVLCVASTDIGYGNLLYWGNSVGVGKPFFITNQSTFSGSLLTITRIALGGAHVPPTKLLSRLAVNHTILKPRVAATWDFPDVIKFRVAAHTIWEKAIRFRHPDYNTDRAQS